MTTIKCFLCGNEGQVFSSPLNNNPVSTIGWIKCDNCENVYFSHKFMSETCKDDSGLLQCPQLWDLSEEENKKARTALSNYFKEAKLNDEILNKILIDNSNHNLVLSDKILYVPISIFEILSKILGETDPLITKIEKKYEYK